MSWRVGLSRRHILIEIASILTPLHERDLVLYPYLLCSDPSLVINLFGLPNVDDPLFPLDLVFDGLLELLVLQSGV